MSVTNEMDTKRLRIGTCVNAMKREVLYNVQAFNLAKINYLSLMKVNTGKEVSDIYARNDAHSRYRSHYHNVNVQAKAKFFGVKASLGVQVQKSTARLVSGSKMKVTINNKLVGQNIELLNLNANSMDYYYNCLFPDVQIAMDKMLNEPDPNEANKAYFNFIETYGTGFISRLFLESGSTATITVESTSDSMTRSRKQSITTSISSRRFGVRAAADFGNAVKTAKIEGTLDVDVETNPHDSPTKEWVKEVMNTFMEKGIETLTQTASFSELPEVEFTPLPDYPKFEEPEKKETPKRKSTEEFDEQESSENEDGQDGEKEKVSHVNVVRETRKLRRKNPLRRSNAIIF